MTNVFIGSEAVADGMVSAGQLRTRYRRVFQDVYVPRDVEPSLDLRTIAAWLWSARSGVITGRAAAKLHGALWVDEHSPIELIHYNNHAPRGILTRYERVSHFEVTEIECMAVASPARTGFDLGRYLPRGKAVAHLDALTRATGVKAAELLGLATLYKGARGVRRLREVADLMDAGGHSPKETWLRLLLIDAGFPRPRTQIPLFDPYGQPFAFLDMGWDDVKIAVEYDGDQHRTDRVRYAWDVRRLRLIYEQGWLHVKVIAEDRAHDIINRVRAAWTRREIEASVVGGAA
jgi:hypothetical protein